MPLSLAPFLSRLLPSRRRRIAPTRTIGVAGTAIYAGYVADHETDPALSSHDARSRTFSKILTDTSIVVAAVRYYTNLIGAAKWSFAPAEADGDGYYAELAEAMLTADPATSWSRIVRRAAMYRLWGFSIQEWTARRREDGWLTLADVAPRAQVTIERWDTDATGEVLGAIQESPQTSEAIYLPRAKLLYLVDDTLHDSPEGLGILRQLVAPAKRLARYEELEGIGFETDLGGIPVVRAPFGDYAEMVSNKRITSAERDKLVKPLQNFIENHVRSTRTGVMLDSATYRNQDESERPSTERMWDVELLQGTSRSFAENAAAIERINREMARILGVEQLLLGADGGSYALSRDKTHAFYLLVEGALSEVREAVETDLLQTLWRLNGWPADMMPVVTTEAVSYTDIAELTAALRDMATAGAVLAPDDPAIDEVRDLMGLSHATEAVSPAIEDDGEGDDGQIGESGA